MRSATFSVARSFDDSENISTEHSQQWLLPGSEQRSAGNSISNQVQLESTQGNPLESTPSREAETRH